MTQAQMDATALTTTPKMHWLPQPQTTSYLHEQTEPTIFVQRGSKTL